MYLIESFITSMIVFLSIIFIFYIISLVVFSNSKYVSGLYKITDKNDKNSNLMNTLINKYKNGLRITFIFIVYLIITDFILTQKDDNKLLINTSYIFTFGSFLFFYFFYSYKMLNIFIKVIIQEAKLR